MIDIGIIWTCKGCEYELFRFEKVGQDYYGVRTPQEIMSYHGNKCPRCGRQLEMPTIFSIQIARKKRKTLDYELI
ncbi:hypothetical protein HS7_21070 [Sulfolobales archaeon HS-7]|nr:hypothetical protein HS7_21070 [Sulfolobales archaeon HS-7]